MKFVLSLVMETMQVLILALSLYYLVIAFFGLYRKKERADNLPPKNSFAIVVAAHNEEMVIGHIVESLDLLDYPDELYDIYIVADNCTDSTAKVAKRQGAIVYERSDSEKKGKGYALEWMFDKIFQMKKNYNAVVIFDADNIVSQNFLREMDRKLKQGFKVVQGFLDSKNPHDSWISESYSLSFWTQNRVFQLARNNMGLSNQLYGTAFCVNTDVLKDLGWGATCLTEDLEFTCKLVLNGYKVGWSHDAVAYDEKPLTLKQSWRQRKRWMQGFADVSSRFTGKLFKKAILERDFAAFDCALYTIQPFTVIGIALFTILTLLLNAAGIGAATILSTLAIPPILWKIVDAFQFMLTPFIIFIERKISKYTLLLFTLFSTSIFSIDTLFTPGKTSAVILTAAHVACMIVFALALGALRGMKSLKIFVWYLLFGLYTFTWIPIIIQGIIDKDKKDWSHTAHTRDISINEMEESNVRSIA